MKYEECGVTWHSVRMIFIGLALALFFFYVVVYMPSCVRQNNREREISRTRSSSTIKIKVEAANKEIKTKRGVYEYMINRWANFQLVDFNRIDQDLRQQALADIFSFSGMKPTSLKYFQKRIGQVSGGKVKLEQLTDQEIDEKLGFRIKTPTVEYLKLVHKDGRAKYFALTP